MVYFGTRRNGIVCGSLPSYVPSRLEGMGPVPSDSFPSPIVVEPLLAMGSVSSAQRDIDSRRLTERVHTRREV